MTPEEFLMDVQTQRTVARIQHEIRETLAPYIGTAMNTGDADGDVEEHIPVLSVRDGQVYVDDVNIASMPEEVTESETREERTHSTSNRRYVYNTEEEVIEHLSQYNGLELTGIVEDMTDAATGERSTIRFNGNDVAMTFNGQPMGEIQELTVPATGIIAEDAGRLGATVELNTEPAPIRMDTEGIHVAGGRISTGRIATGQIRMDDWVTPSYGTTTIGARTYVPPKRYQIDPEKIQNTTDMIRVFRAILDEMTFSQEIVDKFELQDLATERQSPPRTNISGDTIRTGTLQAQSLRTGALRVNDDADAQRIAETMINTVNNAGTVSF